LGPWFQKKERPPRKATAPPCPSGWGPAPEAPRPPAPGAPFQIPGTFHTTVVAGRAKGKAGTSKQVPPSRGTGFGNGGAPVPPFLMWGPLTPTRPPRPPWSVARALKGPLPPGKAPRPWLRAAARLWGACAKKRPRPFSPQRTLKSPAPFGKPRPTALLSGSFAAWPGPPMAPHHRHRLPSHPAPAFQVGPF